MQIVFYAGWFVSSIILGIHIALVVGLHLNRRREAHLPGVKQLTFRNQAPATDWSVSVIVPARDEEALLPGLLESLEKQTMRNFEIVLIDDRSSDDTGQIMEDFKGKHGEKVIVVHNTRDPFDLNGKQHALEIGVQAATGDILLFTDSDCVTSPAWVEGMLRYYSDPSVGLVFGQIVLAADHTFLQKYQRFDQLLINQWSSGAAGLGTPTSCFGNNLSVRRVAMMEVGGFRGLGYTMVEDAALVSAIGKIKKWKVQVSSIQDTVVQPQPQGTWRRFIVQHTRWNNGAFYHPDFLARIEYRFIVLFLVFSVCVIPLAFLHPFFIVFPVSSFLSVGLMGLAAGFFYRRHIPGYFISYVPYTIFFLFFYSLAVVLGIINKPLEWKGKKMQSK